MDELCWVVLTGNRMSLLSLCMDRGMSLMLLNMTFSEFSSIK